MHEYVYCIIKKKFMLQNIQHRTNGSSGLSRILIGCREPLKIGFKIFLGYIILIVI